MPGGHTSSHHRSGHIANRQTFASQPWTLKLVDITIILILIAAPFLMGGRQAMGQLVLCSLSTLSALLWSLHQWRRGDGRWRFTGAEPIMLLGLGLVVLQCWQLSPELLNALSPQVQKLLPEWSPTIQPPLMPGTWNRISFTPNDSWSNFVVLVSSVLFFFVLAQRLKTTDDLRRFVTAVGFAGGAMAILGLLQYFFGNGKFFWVYSHPMTNTRGFAKGAFTNANHFAHFLALSIPAQLLQIVLYFRQSGGSSQPSWSSGANNDGATSLKLSFWGILVLSSMLGILLSGSRAGIFCAIAGVIVVLLVFWQKSLLSAKLTAFVITLSCIVFAATLLFGDKITRGIEQSFSELASNDIETLDRNQARRKIWDANIAGIRQFPLVGTGLASHQEVYWLWYNFPSNGVEYSHAENGYLQIALETGLVGLGAVILLWLIAMLWCAQSLWNAATPRSAGLIGVAAAGFAVSLLHSITDFVWYVPACVNIVLLYAACAWRISLMRFSESSRIDSQPVSSFSLSRLAWGAAMPASLALGFWMVHEKVPEVIAEPIWHEYLALSFAQQGKTQDPDDLEAEKTALIRRIKLATGAAEANPRNHRIQLHAGLACLKRFMLQQHEANNSMPLSQIREAARLSFSSAAERDQWLNRPGVLGDSRFLLDEAIEHFRASLQACPLQPRPYLELSELVWL